MPILPPVSPMSPKLPMPHTPPPTAIATRTISIPSPIPKPIPKPSSNPNPETSPFPSRSVPNPILARLTHVLLLSTLLGAPLTSCQRAEPAPLQGVYHGDPGALFDALHFLPNNRVQIALHAHTQQGIYTIRDQTLELTSDRSTERLLILADGTIDGGPVLGTYRLASSPTSD